MQQLRIHLIEAKELIAADSNGLSDPYAKFNLGDKSAKSKIIYKTLEPRWNETFQLPVKNPETDVLNIQLFDHDTFTKDDKLGSVKVPLNNLKRNSDEDLWLTLEGVPHGKLHIVLTALGFGKGPTPTPSATPSPAATPKPSVSSPTPPQLAPPPSGSSGSPAPVRHSSGAAEEEYHTMPPPKSSVTQPTKPLAPQQPQQPAQSAPQAAKEDNNYHSMPPPKSTQSQQVPVPQQPQSAHQPLPPMPQQQVPQPQPQPQPQMVMMQPIPPQMHQQPMMVQQSPGSGQIAYVMMPPTNPGQQYVPMPASAPGAAPGAYIMVPMAQQQFVPIVQPQQYMQPVNHMQYMQQPRGPVIVPMAPGVIVNHVPITQVYDVGKELGKGSFAVVREATHRQSGSKVAIKIIGKEKLLGDNLKLLRREITNLMALNHPNVLRLYEVYEDQMFFYLVLELIQGKELFDKIVTMGAYTEKDASHLMEQVLSAVAYLHEKGIAHRDLKPENLMSIGSGADEVVKLADFGLSKNFGEEMMKTSCGSPLYIAPEILTADHYDKQVDMWALGVILYILLVGYPPFDASNPPVLYRQIMEGRWTFNSEGWDSISAEAKDLVKGLMTREPTKRLTAQQALQHPWIKKSVELAQRKLPTDRLRSYTKKDLRV